MIKYEYTIAHLAAAPATESGANARPSAAEMAHIAAEIKTFLAFYDPKVRTEIHGLDASAESGAAAQPRLRVSTKIGNGDIVDSAVRVAGLSQHLLASRIGGEPPPQSGTAFQALPGGPFAGALRRALLFVRRCVGFERHFRVDS